MKDIYGVIEKKGQPVVSSRKVAEMFGKEHKNILADIRNTIEQLEINNNLTAENSATKFKEEDNLTAENSATKFKEGNNLTAEFSATNFQESFYKSRGKKYPEYLMTKDGFTLVTMGFTGSKAMRFKIAYIQRFNEMEQFIQSLQQAKLEFPAFTDAIMKSHEEPKHYHFSNELNMINRIVLGVTASQFKKENGIDKKVNSIRPYLSAEQIKAIESLQRIDIGLIVAIEDFYERKRILKEHYGKYFVQKALIA